MLFSPFLLTLGLHVFLMFAKGNLVMEFYLVCNGKLVRHVLTWDRLEISLGPYYLVSVLSSPPGYAWVSVHQGTQTL